MRVIPPIQIRDGLVSASSLVEVAPAFVLGATYALGAVASIGPVGSLQTVYRSLQAGNQGHAPESSPAWWQAIGTTYSVYLASATYAKGARVIDVASHCVYESQKDGNTGESLVLGTAWLLVGPTNYWAPFDRLRNTQAVSPVDISYTLVPGVRTTSIAVIGLDARSVTITVTSAGVEVYSVTLQLSTRKSRRWSEYYFGEFSTRKSIQLYNLPPYRNAQITVTVSKPSGLRAVGGIVIGNSVYLGETQYRPTSDHLNFSVIERDPFGNIKLEPRRSVPKVREEIWFDKALTRRIMDVRELLNGVPAIWSGLDDYTDDYFDPLFIYGPHKEFSLNLAETTHGVISLEVEEL